MDWTARRMIYSTCLQFSLGAGQLPGNARIVCTGGISGAGKGLEQRLDDVVRLVAIKDFKVQIATGLVGESLEELARKAEAERAGGALLLFGFLNFLLRELIQPPPHEMRP